MQVSRKNLISILLLAISVIGTLTLYFYWEDGITQIFLILSLGIFLIMAFLTDVLSDKAFIIVMCINAASLLMTVAYHKSLGIILLFINMILACAVFNNIHVDKKTYVWIHLIPAVLWTLLAIFSVKGSYPVPTGEIWQYKTLGIVFQKNTVGILSLGSIFHWICILEQLPLRKITKILAAIPMFVFPIWKIVESGCRSATIAVIAFCVLYLFLNKTIPYRYYYLIILGIIVCSGLFTIYYVENIVELEFDDIMGGNPFNRLGTWEAAFSLIRRYPVFGSGTDIKMLTYDSAHNTVLSWLKTIGIVPLVTYALFLVKRKQGKENGSYNRAAQVAVMAGLAVSFFESFYADSFFYLSFLLFLINPEEKSYDTESDPLLLVRGKAAATKF